MNEFLLCYTGSAQS